jgi:hypothetical protein
MTRRAEDHIPKVREPVPPMPVAFPVVPDGEGGRDELPGDKVKGSTPGNGVHPHAPARPPAERER